MVKKEQRRVDFWKRNNSQKRLLLPRLSQRFHAALIDRQMDSLRQTRKRRPDWAELRRSREQISSQRISLTNSWRIALPFLTTYTQITALESYLQPRYNLIFNAVLHYMTTIEGATNSAWPISHMIFMSSIHHPQRGSVSSSTQRGRKGPLMASWKMQQNKVFGPNGTSTPLRYSPIRPPPVPF